MGFSHEHTVGVGLWENGRSGNPGKNIVTVHHGRIIKGAAAPLGKAGCMNRVNEEMDKSGVPG